MKKNRMPVRKWSSGRGALLIIGVTFSLSALTRLGGGVGQAIAKEVAELSADVSTTHDPLQCETSESITKILAVLRVRETDMNERQRHLEEKEVSLSLAEDQIRKNLIALTLAEEKLAATIATSETAAESDLARLTSVYENMKPKDAATLFEEMNPNFAAGFMGRMRPDAAAQIMAGLAPKTAYSISVILAGRNANILAE
ncbi:MAG: hypothetical protein KUG69_10705 [Marinosulfonomonas sp.]|nr:hypothetical protein [Marinosulfonomonas sp.]